MTLLFIIFILSLLGIFVAKNDWQALAMFGIGLASVLATLFY